MTASATPFWRAIVAEGGGLKLANLVTLSRGVLIAPIFALLLTGHPLAALGVYIVAASTDLFDGWLARRSGRSSNFGAQLDAVIDNIFSVAILGFLLVAYPGVGDRHAVALWVLFAGPVAYLAISWLLKRRFLMFHFWSAKAGAVLLFCLWPLVAVTGSELWIPIAAALVGLSRLEQIVFILRGGLDLNAPHGLAPISPRLELQP
jgi:phosphatidylglycerophosphate synthase